MVNPFSPRLYVLGRTLVLSSVKDFFLPQPLLIPFPLNVVSVPGSSLGNFSTDPKTFAGNISLLKASGLLQNNILRINAMIEHAILLIIVKHIIRNQIPLNHKPFMKYLNNFLR